MTPSVPKLGNLVEHVSPELAAQAAEKAFVSIPRPPVLKERRRVIEAGERFEVDAGGRLIVGELWGGGPHVHLVHGWAGWHHQLSAHVTPLLESGHQVVAHDALGHGESSPGPLGAGTGTVIDLADSLAAVAAAHGPVAGVVAHSAGAMATFDAMLRHGLTVGRLALIAPSLSLASTMDSFLAAAGHSPDLRPRVLELAAERVGRPASDFEFLDVAERLGDRRPPLLVVHDDTDPESSFDEARALVDSWPGAELVHTSGLGHRKVIWAAETVARVADFFA
ncbi:alpha/beta fold hydrolase [Propionibacteriaceae bacterium Y2011]|uniref:alpha/beta fold hydrolase n=1 Tax=Microlunatus sp. Y2014 TaxID=3418488 RepID=UPI003B474D7C